MSADGQLPEAYARAEEIIHGFHYHGLRAAASALPSDDLGPLGEVLPFVGVGLTALRLFGAFQGAPPPREALEERRQSLLELRARQLIAQREREIADLVRRREAMRSALSGLHKQRDTYQRDLDSYIRECSIAMRQALEKTISTLSFGALELVKVRPQIESLRDVATAERLESSALRDLVAARAAGSGRLSEKASTLIDHLEEVHARYLEQLAAARDYAGLLKYADRASDLLRQVADIASAAKRPEDEAGILRETKHAEESFTAPLWRMVRTLTPEAAMDRLQGKLESVASATERAGRVAMRVGPWARLLVEYGLQSTAFALAYRNGSQMADAIGDATVAERLLVQKADRYTARIALYRQDIQRLRAALGNDAALADVLGDIEARDASDLRSVSAASAGLRV